MKGGVKLERVGWGRYNEVGGRVWGKGDESFKGSKEEEIDKGRYVYGRVKGKCGWISK